MKEARDGMGKILKNDPELHYSYHCNIAMIIYDYDIKINRKRKRKEAVPREYERRQELADLIMQRIFYD